MQLIKERDLSTYMFPTEMIWSILGSLFVFRRNVNPSLLLQNGSY